MRNIKKLDSEPVFDVTEVKKIRNGLEAQDKYHGCQDRDVD